MELVKQHQQDLRTATQFRHGAWRVLTLFVYYLKPKNEMFYLRFEERFALEKEADGSGAQLPGPEAVRQLHFFSSFAFAVIVAAPTPRRSRLAELKRVRT